MMNSTYVPRGIRILLLDMASVIISFFLAGLIRFGELFGPWFNLEYKILFLIILFTYVVLFFVNNKSDDFFRRGFFLESKRVLRLNIMCAFSLATIMYLLKIGTIYARLFFVELFVINVFLDYLFRQYYKIIMLAYIKKSGISSKVMLITTYNKAWEILPNLKEENLSDQVITSIAVLDRDVVGAEIANVPVIANADNLLETIRYEVLDEVFISIASDIDIHLDELIEELITMGIKVKLNIDLLGLKIKEKKIEQYSQYNVLIFTKKEFDVFKIFIKRIMDICGAVVGLIFTSIITIFLAPAIYIESPGPIFFCQTRIGKGGRRFKIYKFRSMRLDAEERKKELLEQNEMSGCMFKITDDPRVTKVGKFIRKTSLDEFPQFYNVLRGDMSLVGTRPPTEDEFLTYISRQRRRLSLRPGLTGLWQVSGRSDISDFEEVVKLDLEYIDTWSLSLDIKLIIKTIWIVLFGKGAR